MGEVPYRPIGKSHYLPAPWNDWDMCSYVPSDMSREALVRGLSKYKNAAKEYTEVELWWAFRHLAGLMSPYWLGDMTAMAETDFDSAFDHVLLDLNLDKSAGFPWYYKYKDKRAVIEDAAALGLVKDLVRRVLNGEQVPLLFSATLKDELRTKDRVLNHKTRVFNASCIVHLIASKMLFGRQNMAMMDNRSRLPFTIGISMPGPEYVSRILSLGGEGGDSARVCQMADIGACDAEFNLGVARVIRELRKLTIPAQYHGAVDHLYDAVYAGHTIAEGGIYQLWRNKSGWEGTIWDTCLYVEGSLYVSTQILYGPRLNYEQDVRRNINGDDLATGCDVECFNLDEIRGVLARHGTTLEVDGPNKVDALDVNFLSHSLVWRYVEGFGDVLVAGGNLPKLESSIHWVKTNEDMTFEESVLAHLLGLRLCLWPFYLAFVDVNEKLDEYIKYIRRHGLWRSTMDLLLKQRIPEIAIFTMHVRLESGFVFSPCSSGIRKIVRCNAGYQTVVLQSNMSANGKPTKQKGKAMGGPISKEEAKARAKQSERDRAAARSGRAPNASIARALANGGVPKSSSALNRVEHDFIAAITNPSESECRMPGIGDEPSVPYCFGPTYNVDFSGATHAGDEIDDKQCVVVKRCDSLLLDSLIWKKTVATASVYTAKFRTINSVSGAATLSDTPVLTAYYGIDCEIDPLYWQYTSGDDLHGDEAFCGKDTMTGKRYMLLSNGSSMALNATTSASGGSLYIYVWVRDGDGRERPIQGFTQAGATNQTNTYTATFTGYFRWSMYTISVTTQQLTVVGMTITAPTTQGVFQQMSVQDIGERFDDVEAFRVLGGSVLLTQAASVTNMNGRGIQVQVPSGRDVLVALKKSFDDYGQSNSKTFKPRDLYNGLYSYKKPADKVIDFRYRNEWEVDEDGLLMEAAYPIVSDTPMLVFYVNVPVAAGRVFTYQPGASVNCSSDSAWMDLDTAPGDDVCVSRALAVLRGVPQHMENETHESFVSQLADMALMAAPFLGSYGPAVGTAAGLIKGITSSSPASQVKRRAPKGFPT